VWGRAAWAASLFFFLIIPEGAGAFYKGALVRVCGIWEEFIGKSCPPSNAEQVDISQITVSIEVERGADYCIAVAFGKLKVVEGSVRFPLPLGLSWDAPKTIPGNKFFMALFALSTHFMRYTVRPDGLAGKSLSGCHSLDPFP
jgi:hypothetical protein